MEKRNFYFCMFVCLALMVNVLGCQPKSKSEIGTEAGTQSGTGSQSKSGSQSQTDSVSPPQSSSAAGTENLSVSEWTTLENAVFLCYANSMFVGTENRITRRSDTEIQVEDISILGLKRYGDAVSAQVSHRENLTHSGSLKNFETNLSMGGAPMNYRGKTDLNSKPGTLLLPVSVSSQGMEQKQFLELALSPGQEVRGGFGVETELLLRPMRVGDSRLLWRFNPTMLRWERVELSCSKTENVTLPSGETYPFCRIETTAQMVDAAGNPDGNQIQKETLWCDGKGLVWKRFSPLMDLSAWRSSAKDLEQYRKNGIYPKAPLPSKPEKALSPASDETSADAGAGTPAGTGTHSESEAAADMPTSNPQPETTPMGSSFDIAENLNVSLHFVNGKGGKPLSEVTETVYRISPLENSGVVLDGIFEQSDFQTVETEKDGTLRITVRKSTLEPFSGTEMPKPTAEDLLPGPMIQSTAPETVALAEKAFAGTVFAGTVFADQDSAGIQTAETQIPEPHLIGKAAETQTSLNPEVSEADARQAVLALEAFVHRFIQNKNYSRGFVTALEVIQEPSGDCTEHAVLLAALARAQKLPARVVQGLIFEPASGKMAWHVWNEVYAGGHWIPADASFGKGGAGADHLRINAGSFSSTSLAQTLLPAAQLIGKIAISAEVKE